MAVKIVLADDHRLVLEALERTLSSDDGFDVVGTTHAGREVLDLVAATRPDMALLDVHMPDLDGLSCLDLLREHHPEVKVVFISAGADAGEIQSILRRGAAGYLVKSINPNDIASALRQIYEGTAFYGAPSGSAPAPPDAPVQDRAEALIARAGLTPKEVEILGVVARGLSNREIAKQLWVTEQTVKFHLSNVYRKLDVANRAAAIRIAMQAGLDSPQPAEA